MDPAKESTYRLKSMWSETLEMPGSPVVRSGRRNKSDREKQMTGKTDGKRMKIV